MSLSTVTSLKAWDETHLLLHVTFLRGETMTELSDSRYFLCLIMFLIFQIPQSGLDKWPDLCVHRGGTKNVEGVSFHRTSSQLASPYLQIFGSSSGGEGNIAAHRGDKLGESNCWQAPHSTQNPSPPHFYGDRAHCKQKEYVYHHFFLILFGLSLVKMSH